MQGFPPGYLPPGSPPVAGATAPAAPAWPSAPPAMPAAPAWPSAPPAMPPGMPAAPGYAPPGFAPPGMPGGFAQPDAAFLAGLNSAAPPATRLPRIEPDAVCDCTVERVHLVPSRKRQTFFEIVLSVDASNHPRMPQGHRFSIFQDCGFDGAQGLIRVWILAMLGHGPNATDVDAAEAAKRAIGPDNPLRGSKVRARAVSRRPTSGAHAGKTLTDCALEPAATTPLPAPVAVTAAPAAPAAPVAPAAPQAPAAGTWRAPDGVLWDLATRQPIAG